MANIEELVIAKMNEAGKPLKQGEIAELADLSKNDVAKAIKKLKNEGKIYSPKRCFYSPNEG